MKKKIVYELVLIYEQATACRCYKAPCLGQHVKLLFFSLRSYQMAILSE